jgi:hypothetical protein
MSIKIAATLSIGILIFSMFVPTIILEETLGENKTFIARLVLGIAMIVVAAMELGVIVLSRNTTMHSRLNWMLPKYCEDPETRQSILKPAGIALFCIVGVYSTDVMFAIAEMSCDEYMALCDSTTSRQDSKPLFPLQQNLFFHRVHVILLHISHATLRRRLLHAAHPVRGLRHCPVALVRVGSRRELFRASLCHQCLFLCSATFPCTFQFIQRSDE